MEIGQYIGHYKIISKIGKGGMGEVYKCYDESLDRFVALKILFPELYRNQEFIHRFKREAKIAAGLTHPNIITIYSIGEAQGLIYFLTEFIEGQDLGDILKRKGKITLVEGLNIVIQVAKGLQFAHKKEIIHRDIKPQNILVNREGYVKITDFGLSKVLSSDTHLTVSGIVLGTPLYMAPEQGKGEAVDHRADIYSLGCTFYHILAGNPPFDAPYPFALIMKHINEPIPSLNNIRSDVPDSICKIIEKMAAKNPKDRYQSYELLIEDLEAVKQGKISNIAKVESYICKRCGKEMWSTVEVVKYWPNINHCDIYCKNCYNCIKQVEREMEKKPFQRSEEGFLKEGFLCKVCGHFVEIGSLPRGQWLWKCPKCDNRSIEYVKMKG